MKFSKLVYISCIISSLFLSGAVSADTCYDPNYDQYYDCAGDEYVAPIAAGILFGVILSNDNGDDGRGHSHNRNHGGEGSHGGHGGNGKHH